MLDLHPVRELPEGSVARERSRAGLWAAGAVVAVIAVVGVVLILATRGGHKAAGQNAAPRPTTAVTHAPSAAPSPSAALPTAVPTSAPTGVTWSLFQTVALPSSTTNGPTRIDGPVHAGYSHTPTGALLATVNIASRYLITPNPDWKQVVEQQVLPGVGRDAFITVRSKITDDTAQPGQLGQLAAFRFVTYTPDVAVIEVVSRFSSSGQTQAATETVKWVDGDWKLELQPDGSTTPSVQQLTSLDRYIRWGGV